MTEIFVKLMAKGLRSMEHDMFTYEIPENTTVEGLVHKLSSDYQERFQIYFEENSTSKLRRDTIVLVNGANMVSKSGLDTNLSKGDLVVFMIAAVGG